MTNKAPSAEERAKRIVDWLNPSRIKHTISAPSLAEQKIIAAIKSAEEAAYERGRTERNGKCDGGHQQSFKDGWNAALEEAAHVSDKHCACGEHDLDDGPCIFKELAMDIRALKGTPDKGHKRSK